MKSDFLWAYGFCLNILQVVLDDHILSVPVQEQWNNCPLLNNSLSKAYRHLAILEASVSDAASRLKVIKFARGKVETRTDTTRSVQKCSLKSNENGCPLENYHLHFFN